MVVESNDLETSLVTHPKSVTVLSAKMFPDGEPFDGRPTVGDTVGLRLGGRGKIIPAISISA